MSKWQSKRLAELGSAIFSEVAQWKREVQAGGVDVIDLGIGSPDRGPSDRVRAALAEAVSDPGQYGYPTSEGSLLFRQTVAKWYRHRFGVELDPEREVVTLMGSQDGLAHLAMAVTDPGDTVMVPDPGYPIYAASLVLAGVEPYFLPLRAENGFLPQLGEIPEETARRAKFILLNYPSNPLSAVATRPFFEELVRFAKRHDLLIVHDVAYSEMAYDGFRPPSILEVEGAKEVAVEFHSLSKSFNMAGCRIAFMVGQPDAVQALRILKSNIDYGVFLPVQRAGIAALEEDMEPGSVSVAGLYERRRDLVVDGLRAAGWELPKPQATMFIWAPIPPGWTSRQISREMLYSAGVVVIPGDAFGREGEGYVRIALVQEEDRLQEAVRRIGAFLQGAGQCPGTNSQ
ncbi:aminotransferase class I/II-fold pyridoxal phosphate-dependent enzyme [Paenibacillus mucilaginosus]|uniref:Aminotransferase n=2 Tax=Paenibacillus mucilaginosus TaxID=61624 RepID=H6NGF2_9BACL|nr:aminotransferase class I/II-fold pyridoxal phosphate-dependent enzyme [Paenibacillus mucilaginosus]AEI45302.1 aminotransferase class I and II [Paenibacillus mucilaginosus KNP414]AFC33034.1 class I and II aminotransferase [Paenibacillus mucilaginosus 3016]MCG7212814.1 aminotransferase class I/II-fold pyridoxal phosphate-dependent enzyme [Paenibacillus mucilaginosus]WDM26762.1 aminotransferase class I/II-fold pyridoxal phosphate-dependent enzyme [Paenibacillus mucilaginosus]WFA22777.1 aminotr